MSSLQQTLEKHALELAMAIMNAVRSASIEELVEMTGGMTTSRADRPRPVARRASEDVASRLASIVSVLTHHPEGLRAEQIRAELQMEKRDILKPIAEGLASGALRKKGQRRATVYFVGRAKK